MEPVVQTYRTSKRERGEPCSPASIERGVRQLLADKVSGSLVGVWLLVPEYLRLGVWDLLRGWTARGDEQLEPRLALQLVNEAALCVTGIRQQRSLSQKGFEVACGLPFVASDPAVHTLLDAHTIQEAQKVQVALGKIRRAGGHFKARLLAIDPHRMRSYSKRQMRRRQSKGQTTPHKCAQTFFCLDLDTGQPVAFTTATASRTVTQATPELLALASDVLGGVDSPLVLADTEHLSAQLYDHVLDQTPFDLLVPVPRQKEVYKEIRALPPACWTPRWAGYATMVRPYRFVHSSNPFYQFLQRTGEAPGEYRFKAFVSTSMRDEVDSLTRDYPERWHIEEFFNAYQGLGWKRAGTMNLHIRYGAMTMALLAQAATHQLRQRLGEPYKHWEAQHFARELLSGLDGDLRVRDDTLLVTFYNAPNLDRLRPLYENLPARLHREHVDSRIPWLYGFKLDFRFR